jgi:cytochrome c-type biogenesis protein CcmH
VKKVFLLLCVLGFSAWAQEPLVFDSAELQARFNVLTEELRCLVCQNQNLADSDAPLAHDLRNEIFSMLQQGSNNDEIKSFLVERYGDFVLYRPPVKGNTMVLWLAPGVLLLGGALVIVSVVRKRGKMLTVRTDDGGGSNDT